MRFRFRNLKVKKGWFLLVLCLLSFGCAVSERRNSTQANVKRSVPVSTKLPVISLPLEMFNAGFFSIEKPRGWEVFTGGHCDTFAFVVRDPGHPLRRVFYFAGIGPVYMYAQQKQIDAQYMNSGGYPVQWFEMPVVQPFTPDNFLSSFHLVARTNIARQFMPHVPLLDHVQIIAKSPLQSPFSQHGGGTALIRALFQENGQVGEGLFLVSTDPRTPFMNGPGGGTGYGMMFTGITAPEREFRFVVASLMRSIGTFNTSQGYVEQCIAESQKAFGAAIQAGRTLREAADDYNKAWERRSHVEDILSEKWSDTILGKERLYNPGTGEVYEFDNGFYDKYQKDPNSYRYADLRPLNNNDYDLWMKPAVNGYREIR